MPRRLLPLAACVIAACASTPSPAPVDWRSLPPLPRSSLAAVLDEAQSLSLTPAQVERLEAADDRLAEQVEAARAELRARREAEQKAQRTEHERGGPAQRPMPGGMAPGMGGGGSRGWGGARGGRPPGAEGAPGRGLPVPPALAERFNDLDTAAMLSVEGVFTPAQHDRAMTVASRFREQLFERQRLMRQARGGARGEDEAPH